MSYPVAKHYKAATGTDFAVKQNMTVAKQYVIKIGMRLRIFGSPRHHRLAIISKITVIFSGRSLA